MTSRRTGFDRQTFNKEEFDALPFPDIAKLPAATKASIRSLAQRLQCDSRKPWRELNEFIFGLYGLDADAVQVASDTLFAAASYRKAGRAPLDRTMLAGVGHIRVNTNHAGLLVDGEVADLLGEILAEPELPARQQGSLARTDVDG